MWIFKETKKKNFQITWDKILIEFITERKI